MGRAVCASMLPSATDSARPVIFTPVPSWLESVRAHAATLSESTVFSANDEGTADPAALGVNADDRLDRWRRHAADGDEEKFRARLAWSGLTEASARRACGTTPPPETTPLPEWADLLWRIVEESAASIPFSTDADSSANTSALPAPLEKDQPLPFEHVLLPAVKVARRWMHSALAEDAGWNDWSATHLANAVWHTRERALLRELVELARRPLMAEFARQRPEGLVLFDALCTSNDAPRETERYRTFVTDVLRDGGAAWFQRYPVLARLIAKRTLFWVEATAELLRRVKADWAQLGESFGRDGIAARKLADLSPSLSDSHHQGRCVMVLTFSNGTKVVYKPKQLKLAVRYNEFLAAANVAVATGHRSSLLPLKTLRILDRGDYGWVEFVSILPCTDAAAAARYYFRAGELLCVAHLLRGTDFHFENLIACGEDPVLVDVESLFHARVPRDTKDDGASAAAIHDRFWDSVMETGLLPRWNVAVDETAAFDVSGFGCVSPHHVRGKIRRWHAINTDAMRAEFEAATATPPGNVPSVAGRPIPFGEHIEDCVAGFRAMYCFLIAWRPSLLESEIWQRFRNLPVRFIFRPTKVYSALLQKSLEPCLLRRGVDRSLEFEVLTRAIMNRSNPQRLAPLLGSEIAALEVGDVPCFATNSSSVEAELGFAKTEHGGNPPSAFECATQRLLGFDAADLEWQCELIMGATHARVLGETEAVTPTVPREPVDASRGLAAGEALREAIRIGDELVARAWGGSGRGLTWLGFTYFPPARRFQFEPLGRDLYDGAPGVALFLSALGAATGDERYATTALRAVQPIREGLQGDDAQSRARHAKRLGLGGLHGLGSVIYSLVRMSGFLKAPALLEHAANVAAFIDSEQLRAARTPEVMTGTAGALLALLRLHAASGDAMVKARATECADNIVSKISLRGPCPVAGFAHGVGGISYALRQAHAQLRNPAYLRAAEAAEHAGQETNRGALGRLKVNWCQGAIGLGLARLATEDPHASSAPDGFVLEQTASLAAAAGLQALDHVCCGNFGTVEFFLRAHRRPEAAALAQAALQRRERHGGFNLFGRPGKPIYHPGFFQGTAGIGYTLLRLHDESLPCVLLLE